MFFFACDGAILLDFNGCLITKSFPVDTCGIDLCMCLNHDFNFLISNDQGMARSCFYGSASVSIFSHLLIVPFYLVFPLRQCEDAKIGFRSYSIF